jgi:hypothetical protein
MKDLEILTRASAFLVKANNRLLGHHLFDSKDSSMHTKTGIKYSPLKDNSYHVITSSHVVAPWRYPKYYSQEFIKYIDETHTHYTVELRNEDGTFITQTELIPRSFHHKDKDLAVLHIEDEGSAMKLLESFEFQPLELLDDGITLQGGDSLVFHGHDVRGGDHFSSESGDDRKPYPCVVSGNYFSRTAHQSFSKTLPVLTDGMCGGPVLFAEQGVSKVCGIVEGIVPTSHPSDDLKGLACFVDSKIISKFIDDLEQGKVQPLMGGECAIAVGSDQDAQKMNITKILHEDSNHPNSYFP